MFEERLNQLQPQFRKFMNALYLPEVRPWFIFDIHNTVEYDNNKIDQEIKSFIDQYKNKFYFMFLSYDTNSEIIDHNTELIDQNFENSIQVYIGKRQKYLILQELELWLDEKNNGSQHTILFYIDDKLDNILMYRGWIANNIYHPFIAQYTKHSRFKDKTKYSHENFQDLREKLHL